MKHLPVVLIFAIGVGCQPAEQQVQRLDPVQVEEAVRTTLEAYFAATRENGPLAGLTFLDTSEQFFWVPPGYNSAIKRDSVVTVITSFAPAIQSIDNRWVNLEVHALDQHSAVFTGEVQSRSTDTAGSSTETLLLETGVMVLREDGWKMLCGQTRVK